MGSIDHPSIVRVLAHGEDGDERYTALELIDGPDLREHLVQTGPLPWRQVIELGIQVADALEVVHRQGLIHRRYELIGLAGTGAKDATVHALRSGTLVFVTS